MMQMQPVPVVLSFIFAASICTCLSEQLLSAHNLLGPCFICLSPVPACICVLSLNVCAVQLPLRIYAAATIISAVSAPVCVQLPPAATIISAVSAPIYVCSCYLYLGSILVDEYAGEAGCIPGLLPMLPLSLLYPPPFFAAATCTWALSWWTSMRVRRAVSPSCSLCCYLYLCCICPLYVCSCYLYLGSILVDEYAVYMPTVCVQLLLLSMLYLPPFFAAATCTWALFWWTSMRVRRAVSPACSQCCSTLSRPPTPSSRGRTVSGTIPALWTTFSGSTPGLCSVRPSTISR
jgi:hypothetical protein